MVKEIQMSCFVSVHGDEPTATMALFIFLNFLKANDHFFILEKF